MALMVARVALSTGFIPGIVSSAFTLESGTEIQ
jgi:predicted amidohydrolase